LVERGLIESREKAKRVIMAGLVKVGEVRADKPGQLIPRTSPLNLKKAAPPYVSRGGLKLEAALNAFSVMVKNKVVLDVGASTGGFTDCLLQRDARQVIALDVGYGQLHWKLRQDPRVRVLERTNIRQMNPSDLKATIHGAVIDTSFISLKLVVPAVSDLLAANAFIIALIKPQFEVGRGKVGKGGVVRDPALHEAVLSDLIRFFQKCGWAVRGTLPSPILGPKGNREFLIHLER
jgi:23S rRNA (cytidine1920-2'-O)/16S rRNA (cytidine1409-2'-O)-methyltransferase